MKNLIIYNTIPKNNSHTKNIRMILDNELQILYPNIHGKQHILNDDVTLSLFLLYALNIMSVCCILLSVSWKLSCVLNNISIIASTFSGFLYLLSPTMAVITFLYFFFLLVSIIVVTVELYNIYNYMCMNE